MEKCPIDIDKAHYDELLYFALYGKPGVLTDADPLLLTYINQRVPPEKQVPTAELKTDDPIILDLLGIKNLNKPPEIREKLPVEIKNEGDLPVYKRSYIVNFNWNAFREEDRALDYDKYLEVDHSHPTPRMCRLLTMVCIKLLLYLEKHLKSCLEKCRWDLAVLKEKIKETKGYSMKGTQKRSWVSLYGMPYFKDRSYFPCPKNEDFQRKKQNKEALIVHFTTTGYWTSHEQIKLQNIIRKEAIQKRTAQVEHEMSRLLKCIEAAKDEEVKAEFQAKLRELPSKSSINNMQLEDLCEDEDEYDWLKISAKDFDGYRDPEEYRTFWKKCLHPKINKSAWTKDEDERLKELVANFKFQNWDLIAKKLGTNRADIHVMQHYQRNINPKFASKVWSEEDDELLVQAVESSIIAGRICWSTVADQLKAYPKSQLFKQWTTRLNPELKKGPFTKREDMLLVAAVRSYGDDFPRISELFPHRTLVQLRSRYKALAKVQRNPWTNEDNLKLMSLVERFGEGRWKEISEYFTNHNWIAIKEQYAELKQKMDSVIEEEDTFCQEQKVWKKVQEILPNVKESNKIDHDSLNQLKCMLYREAKVVKIERAATVFDRECYSYLKCISDPDAENEIYDKRKRLDNVKVIQCALHVLQARLHVPKDVTTSRRDRQILQKLAKESFTVSEDANGDTREMPYRFPPNYTTLAGFCSLLLHRRYLLDTLGHKRVKLPELSGAAKQSDLVLKHRLQNLFLWPALASAEPPKIHETFIEGPTHIQVRRERPAEDDLELGGPLKKRKYIKSGDYVGIYKSKIGRAAAKPEDINNKHESSVATTSGVKTYARTKKNLTPP